jgi:alanine racemase
MDLWSNCGHVSITLRVFQRHERFLMRPIRAALQHNLAVVRRHAGRARTWAVVKADAYGHGLARLLTTLVAPLPAGTDGLALLEFDAAAWLRDARVGRPLLMLEGFFSSQELSACSRLQLTPVVHDEEQLRMIELASLATPIDVHFKLNTGMNRLGFASDAAPSAFRRLRASKNVRDITVMMHFADADGPTGIGGQMSRFASTLDAIPEAKDLPRSCANSAGILRYPESHAEWVRPGIMLYGCTPFADEMENKAEALGLQPVMTLASRIIAVQVLKPGERIGYGGTYTATQPMRIGVVAVGYADGYPRHAPGSNERGTPVLVCGKRTRTVGRVSMDMIYVDITALPEAGVGSDVTLWGDGLSADEVAGAAGTVSYELLCALAPRVPVDVI